MKRSLLCLLAGLAAAAVVTSPPATAKPHQCVKLPERKIGAQLYSFVDAIVPAGQTFDAQLASRTVPASFQDLNRAGFRQIERFGGTLRLPYPQYTKLLRDKQLTSVASHADLNPATWPASVDEASRLGQRFIGSGNFGKPGLKSLEDVLSTAAQLNNFGKQAAARGLRFYVHNHSEEFTRKYRYKFRPSDVPRLVSAWEIIAANTDPKYVSFELDVYWAQKAFGPGDRVSVPNLLRRYRNRIVMLHIKDMAEDGAMTDLGQGIINWPTIIKAAGPGISYYLWELDRAPHPARSAATAFAFMRCASTKRI